MLRHSFRKGFQICGFLLLVMMGYQYRHYWRYGRDYSNHIVPEPSSIRGPQSSPRLQTAAQFQPQQQDNLIANNGHFNRFILSLNYWEQFTMATSNLFSLVCLGKLWNTTLVQPFTYNSRLYGLRNFKPDDNFYQNTSAKSLDLIYDTNSLKKVLLQYKLPKLTDFETFLRCSTRNITVAHYISSKEAHELSVMSGPGREDIEKGFRQNSIIDCKNYLYGYLEMIERALNKELDHQGLPQVGWFHVVNYWCVNMSEFNTPSKSAAMMELKPEDNVTLIVVNWRGMGSKPVFIKSVRGIHLNNRIAMLNSSCRPYNTRNIIAYSSHVMKASKLFTASLGMKPGSPFAAVHLRSEKLGIREPRMPGVTVRCLEEMTKLEELLAEKYPSIQIVYFTDYGPHSSDTCKECKGSKYVRKYLRKRGITPTYFEPSYFNLTLDDGFAAAVESQFLASANFLFLCGGGGYQSQIAARFHELRHKMVRKGQKKLFSICSDDKKINKIINPDLGTV